MKINANKPKNRVSIVLENSLIAKIEIVRRQLGIGEAKPSTSRVVAEALQRGLAQLEAEATRA